MWKKALQPVDNAPLLVFRIFFGFLFACESFGALATGWVRENMVDVKLTFSHIYMDFLQVLVGPQMYVYFFVMGLVSVAVMLGYRYKWSMPLLTLLWAGAYFLQKTSYNNHYYMLLIICVYMCFLPAASYKSLDVKANRVKEELSMPLYFNWIFIFQVSVLYIYGTVAKFYPDWLDGTFTELMYNSANIPDAFKNVFTQKEFYLVIAYLGIIFDGLIVPALLWKRTRTLGLIASLIFHLFNSATLHIGIFPYFALTFAVFFYPSSQIQRIFFKKKPVLEEKTNFTTPQLSKPVLAFLAIFMFFQFALPLRHHFIEGDVLWTDEAHRLSWRMMLRSRAGYTTFIVENKNTKERYFYPSEHILSSKQNSRLNTSDMIWQMAQYIKEDYANQGIDVAVYADSWVSINGRSYSRYIDEKTDLASTPWNYFSHSEWILDKPF
ncbi:HTTM domain-containing protein [Myroides odoratus]|uniref:HTTM domain-containing protein n=1 Tax=Myroides odoratus TaxID=256 RepID=UPI0039AF2FA0